jgi:hypothetical protein
MTDVLIRREKFGHRVQGGKHHMKWKQILKWSIYNLKYDRGCGPLPEARRKVWDRFSFSFQKKSAQLIF